MSSLASLLKSNARWSDHIQLENPGLVEKLVAGQSPRFLWIGCSDSRVPETVITGMQPGDLFVHRNIANIAGHDDSNCQSVIQFAVSQLKVQYVLVCGHYGCGGVQAATSSASLSGPIDAWLEPIRLIAKRHESELARIDDPKQRMDRLCELNVLHQVLQVCDALPVREAWRDGWPLSVCGLIFDISTATIRELGLSASSVRDVVQLRNAHQL